MSRSITNKLNLLIALFLGLALTLFAISPSFAQMEPPLPEPIHDGDHDSGHDGHHGHDYDYHGDHYTDTHGYDGDWSDMPDFDFDGDWPEPGDVISFTLPDGTVITETVPDWDDMHDWPHHGGHHDNDYYTDTHDYDGDWPDMPDFDGDWPEPGDVISFTLPDGTVITETVPAWDDMPDWSYHDDHGYDGDWSDMPDFDFDFDFDSPEEWPEFGEPITITLPDGSVITDTFELPDFDHHGCGCPDGWPGMPMPMPEMEGDMFAEYEEWLEDHADQLHNEWHDWTEEWYDGDWDDDGESDDVDMDDDNDGYADDVDDFPFDDDEAEDSDDDGEGDNADMDDDNDGHHDRHDWDDDGDGRPDFAELGAQFGVEMGAGGDGSFFIFRGEGFRPGASFDILIDGVMMGSGMMDGRGHCNFAIEDVEGGGDTEHEVVIVVDEEETSEPETVVVDDKEDVLPLSSFTGQIIPLSGAAVPTAISMSNTGASTAAMSALVAMLTVLAAGATVVVTKRN